jgi:hypothetical protein
MTLDAVVEWLRADWIDIAVVCVTLVVGYVIFGIAGFGAVLVVAPVLALLRMPVATIVPLMALLDLVAAVINGIKLSDRIDRTELSWLVPLMIGGSIAGATLLLSAPARQMMIALGLFIVAYGICGLFAPPIRVRLGRAWVFPFGLVGGLFSGMFGSGGFIYSIYLSRRLADKNDIRATQSALIGLSAFHFPRRRRLYGFTTAVAGRGGTSGAGAWNFHRSSRDSAAVAATIPARTLCRADGDGRRSHSEGSQLILDQTVRCSGRSGRSVTITMANKAQAAARRKTARGAP